LLFKLHDFYKKINCLIIECSYICKCRLEGELVKKGLAMNIPVVNLQWLIDVLFGVEITMNISTNIKYQQFDLCNPFLVNFNMVSQLMGMVSINYTILYLLHCLLICKIS